MHARKYSNISKAFVSKFLFTKEQWLKNEINIKAKIFFFDFNKPISIFETTAEKKIPEIKNYQSQMN